jgi:hypothetical protein
MLATDISCIVTDLDLIDGKRIAQILPDWLTSSVKDGVAFEAVYMDDDDETLRHHRGVFLIAPTASADNTFFLFEIDESKFRVVQGRE